MLTFYTFIYLIIALRSWFINSVKYIFHLISYFIRNHHPVGPRTTDTQRLYLKFFAAQIQIPLPNIYLGVRYKGLVFWRMENMGADSPAENTPNASKNFIPKCLPKPQKFEIFEKKKLSLGVRSPWVGPSKRSQACIPKIFIDGLCDFQLETCAIVQAERSRLFPWKFGAYRPPSEGRALIQLAQSCRLPR